jgi:hypothetical protein
MDSFDSDFKISNTREALGPCPLCGGDVYLHKTESYVLCEDRVTNCTFTLNRGYLSAWGVESFSINTLKKLLAGRTIKGRAKHPISGKECVIEIRIDVIEQTGKHGIKIVKTHY